MKEKVLIGLSGGVDSSVATHILLKKGYDVSGVTMKVYDSKKYPNLTSGSRSSCFGGDEEEDIEDARNVAKHFDIPFYVIDLSDRYEEIVLNYFRDEYKSGRTPNPCIKCNQQIKFGMLVEESTKAGIDFDYFATGHYAKVEFDEASKRYLLKKANFIEKDQSYFLSFLSQKQLSKILLPLGEYSKTETRNIAKEIGLFTQDKVESQDFYSGDYKELFESAGKEGDIVDKSGKIVGKHNGIENYTIGQRKRLGISSNQPLYVVKLDKDKNQVVVDIEKGLFSTNLIASHLNWIGVEKIKEPFSAKVKIRYRHSEALATIYPKEDDKIEVIFATPEKSITPGQVAVIYNDDIVLGAGFIE